MYIHMCIYVCMYVVMVARGEIGKRRRVYADDFPLAPRTRLLLLRDTAVSISRPRPQGSLWPPSSRGSFGQMVVEMVACISGGER